MEFQKIIPLEKYKQKEADITPNFLRKREREVFAKMACFIHKEKGEELFRTELRK